MDDRWCLPSEIRRFFADVFVEAEVKIDLLPATVLVLFCVPLLLRAHIFAAALCYFVSFADLLETSVG